MDQIFTSGLLSFILFEILVLLVIASNLRALRRLGEYAPPTDWPRVSILLPARNEAANIGPCVQSLLAQYYASF